MSIRLRLRQQPALRLDLRGLTPAALATLTTAQIERLPLAQGRRESPLAEHFEVSVSTTPTDDTGLLMFEGDLSRCDRIGWQMAAGQIVVEGAVGHYAGAGLLGGAMQVKGHAGLLAACEMAGGSLVIDGDVGDFAASAQPGSLDGMRGGRLVVRGNAGQRFGDRMRRGTAWVFGDAGDFYASRLVAGTIAIGGRVGAHPAYGMRRGSLVFAGSAPQLPPHFVPAIVGAPVVWQLLARALAREGGPFADLPARHMQRHLGDRSVAGVGELYVAD
ncbi:MAG: formylmethanofuran dehydrogenase subunit C [Rubrivivax sp.]